MNRVKRLPREPEADRLARVAHINVLVAALRFNDEMERRCAAEGASAQQYRALYVLCLHDDADEGVPVSALADGLLVRAADLTRLVDKLERGGLAERRPSPTDRRVVLVRATAAGREAFVRMEPTLRDMHRAEWAALTTDELRQLHHLLSKALWADQSAPAITPPS